MFEKFAQDVLPTITGLNGTFCNHKQEMRKLFWGNESFLKPTRPKSNVLTFMSFSYISKHLQLRRCDVKKWTQSMAIHAMNCNAEYGLQSKKRAGQFFTDKMWIRWEGEEK